MINEALKDILKILAINPVIPCMDSYEEIFSSYYDGIKIIFFYDLGIFDLIEISKKNINAKKNIILHMDSLKGISADEEGAKFIKKYLNINIICSSSPKLINCFKKFDFLTIQSIFVMDTKSTKKGIQLINTGRPHLIDIRPGILYPKTANILMKDFPEIPVICSGFVNNKEDLENILENGAKGITTSKKELWKLFL